jgi:hypothetical protein
MVSLRKAEGVVSSGDETSISKVIMQLTLKMIAGTKNSTIGHNKMRKLQGFSIMKMKRTLILKFMRTQLMKWILISSKITSNSREISTY